MKKATNIILAVLTAAGTVGTGVLSVFATPRAEKAIAKEQKRSTATLNAWDKVRIGWKFYIPAAGVCLATIASTVVSCVGNEKSRKAMASSYILLEKAYKNYRSYIKDHYGVDVDGEAITDVVSKAVPTDLREGDDDEKLFYDEYSARYFHATKEQMLLAEYHFNRNFALRSYATLNEFYEFVDSPELPKTEIGEKVGWSYEAGAALYGYEWVDFDHLLTTTDDGLECYILSFPFPPTEDYEDPEGLYV